MQTVEKETLTQEAFQEWLREQDPDKRYPGYSPTHNPLAVWIRETIGGSVRLYSGKVCGARMADVRLEMPSWMATFDHTIAGSRSDYAVPGITAAECLELLA